MRDIVEFVKMTLFFLGFVDPIFWGVWIGFCKYVLHFHRGVITINACTGVINVHV